MNRKQKSHLEESAKYISSVRPPPMKGKKPRPDRSISNEQIIAFPHCMSQPPKKATEAWEIVVEHFADIRRAQMNGGKADSYSAEEVATAIGNLTAADRNQIKYYIAKLVEMSPYEEVREAARAVTY